MQQSNQVFFYGPCLINFKSENAQKVHFCARKFFMSVNFRKTISHLQQASLVNKRRINPPNVANRPIAALYWLDQSTALEPHKKNPKQTEPST
jgi:hypothetical protein